MNQSASPDLHYGYSKLLNYSASKIFNNIQYYYKSYVTQREHFENLVLNLVLFQTNNSPLESNFCNLEFITESR